ncbi:MAG: flagellar hook-associated protein FlgK [Treponemataceae bacterium]|nr:flagellar hook-associated protein FlgK [Treponemataceae bacterium]
MASSFAGIEMGKRSLMAQAQAINTAGHNVSNADTEGYSRQRVQVRAFDPIYRPDLSRAETPGQIGQGVTVQSIERIRDEMLDKRIVAQSNQESYWETREKYYFMIENVYNEPDNVSIRTTMDKFWESWQELSMYPESTAARMSVISRGDSLVNSIHNRHKGLEGINTLINGDIEASVKQVNDITNQIAEINREIVNSKAMGDNPNDLLDRRDLLVEKLSSLINVTTDDRDPDEFMVHIDGHILVQGKVARNFAVEPILDGTGYSKVIWADTENDAVITGGSLGALIELRDVDIRYEKQNLNTMVMNFADLVNDVHRNAIGANNVTGLDFFVEQPFVMNVNGNYDRNGDGVEDTSYIFRVSGKNSLKETEQIGLEGTITISGKNSNIQVPYYSTDSVAAVVKRINDYDGEVKAYLDKNNKLVLKATTAYDSANPDFVIRHIEDSGHFLVGYAGILRGRGEEGAFDFARADAVNAFVADTAEVVSGKLESGAQFSVAPVADPAAYFEINPALKRDVLSVAASYPIYNTSREDGDGRAALEIAGLRNSNIMIGRSATLDDYFADSVTHVGLKGEQAEMNLASQRSIMEDLRSLRESISGVNIDEELADIIKFQHGYNAAAKIVTVMDEMLDTVINRLGV